MSLHCRLPPIVHAGSLRGEAAFAACGVRPVCRALACDEMETALSFSQRGAAPTY
jgi:hypothetical protein